jgi:hypothetical protein
MENSHSGPMTVRIVIGNYTVGKRAFASATHARFLYHGQVLQMGVAVRLLFIVMTVVGLIGFVTMIVFVLTR